MINLERSMSDMESNVHDSVAGAMVAGLAIGIAQKRQREEARHQQSWENYGASLQQQVDDLKHTIRVKDAQLFAKDAKIAHKDALLDKKELEVKEQTDQATSFHSLLNYMTHQAAQLEKDLKRQSCNTKVVHALYQRLVSDIKEVSDPKNFSSLNADERLKIMREEWDEYDRTGEMVYKVNITSWSIAF